jgi:hypothetical protein
MPYAPTQMEATGIQYKSIYKITSQITVRLLNNKAERNWKEQGVTRCTNELDGAEFFL